MIKAGKMEDGIHVDIKGVGEDISGEMTMLIEKFITDVLEEDDVDGFLDELAKDWLKFREARKGDIDETHVC